MNLKLGFFLNDKSYFTLNIKKVNSIIWGSNTVLNKNIIFFPILYFLLLSSSLKAQENKITFNVVVLNNVDGNPIKNTTVKVTNKTDNLELKLITKKNEQYYEVSSNKEVLITVNAVGFYTEEAQYYPEEIKDGDYLEIRLGPKPSGQLVIRVIDSATKKPVEADVEITFFAKNQKEKLTVSNPEIAYFYELKGKYKIITIAKGYLNDVRELNLDISTGQFVTKEVIELVSNRKNQIIEVFDKSSNTPLFSQGVVAITHKETNQKVFEGKAIGNKINFDGYLNDQYIATFSAEGYTTFSENFKLEGKPLKFGLSPITSVDIDIFDEETDKRLSIDLELVSPTKIGTKLKTSENSSIKFVPTEIGTYTITSKAKGYMNKSGTIVIKSLAAGNSFYSLRLSSGSNEYEINVFDADTKQPVNNAIVKVFDDQSKEIQGKTLKNQKKVTLESEKKHFYEVSASGYFDYTSNISFDKSIQVYLKKIEADKLETFKFFVLDAQTKLPIKEARIRIFDETGKPIPVNFQSDKLVFVTDKINLKNNYSLEINAKGYNNLKENLNKSENERNIFLSSTDLKPYTFEFMDAFTQKPIIMDFKLMVEKSEIELENSQNTYKALLSNNNTYQISAKNQEYKDFEKQLNLNEAKSEIFKFSFYRNYYPITINIKPKLENKQWEKADIVIKEKNTGKKIETNINKENGNIEANFINGVQYNLDFTFEDFEKFNQTISLSLINPANFSYDVTLKTSKKPEEKAEPKKLEIEKTNTVSETTIKVEKEPEKNIPKNPEPLLVSNKTTKFNTEGLIFEKSSTQIKPGSEAQLDELIKILNNDKTLKVEIIGHTDNEGLDPRPNQRLSEFRAKLVANYLFNKGIQMDRILTYGKGSTEPIAANDTEENRAKNRRVEINIIELR
jgi:outer membrane protein OmpA-like peptidoglycan-associated protein